MPVARPGRPNSKCFPITDLCCEVVFEPMSKQKYGRIVNTASIWTEGHVGQAGYSAAKAGVIGLTKTLALEYAKYQITVKLPAHPVRTGQARRGFTDSRDFPVSAKMRLPDKNARPIRFLKSLHSSPPTGRGILQHFRKSPVRSTLKTKGICSVCQV